MNLRVLLLFAAAVALGAVEAGSIDHDKVQPFAQPEPVTDSEKTAIKFKPSLLIDDGCHPYPAVNAAGETSGGLKGSGSPDGGCKGSSLGSQVYGRAVWYNDMWAIMYAWYFPKDKSHSIIHKGIRHSWASVVVWLDNPSLENLTMVGVSYQVDVNVFDEYIPPPSNGLNGTTAMVNYVLHGTKGGYPWLDTTSKTGGEFQDLIMWEQLTDEARDALNTADIGDIEVPFKDANFESTVSKAWLECLELGGGINSICLS